MTGTRHPVDLALLVPLGAGDVVGLLAAPDAWAADVGVVGARCVQLDDASLAGLGPRTLDALVLGSEAPLTLDLLRRAHIVLKPGSHLLALVPSRGARRSRRALRASPFDEVSWFGAEPAEAPAALVLLSDPALVRSHLSTLRPVNSRRDVVLRRLAPLLLALRGASAQYPSNLLIARRRAS